VGSNSTKDCLSLLKNSSVIVCERTKVLDGIINVMRILRSLEKNSIIGSSAPLWCGGLKRCSCVSGWWGESVVSIGVTEI